MAAVPEELIEEKREAAIRRMVEDPWAAHRYLFSHRHPERSSAAHQECVRAIWDPHPRANIEGFRGFGKSTLLEEALIIRAARRLHKNMLIVGASEARAIERLAAIKSEILTNERLEASFGQLKAEPWQETKIVLANGTCIQALGRDQSILGLKYLDWRPDAVMVDDVEPADEQRSDAERAKTWGWFTRALVPSLDSPLHSWIRVLGTRRGQGSLSERLETVGWPTAKFPIERLGPEGQRQATWPAKFPLDEVDRLRDLYRGDMHAFDQEFMCRAYSEEARVFHPSQFRCEEVERSWQATFVMYDPARTRTQSSATTGKAVWSWVGSRLIVWEAGGYFWSPEELIQDIILTARRYQPAWIAVEKTGLNEWLMQPLRHQMLKEGILLPLWGVEAPRGKLDFIRALQPLFAAGEIICAGSREDFKTLFEQLLSFPRGRIDAPNALAYARLLHPGEPVLDGFGSRHIGLDARAIHDHALYVAANAAGGVVSAQLLQRQGRTLSVLADFVRQGTPREVAQDLNAEIALSHSATRLVERDRYGAGGDIFKIPLVEPRLVRTEPKWLVPPKHFNEWHNEGLVQAIRALPAPCAMGGKEEMGRGELQRLLEREGGIVVSEEATWTLRALSGGYAKNLGSPGPKGAPATGQIYKTLMEGLESFCATGIDHEESASTTPISPQPIAYTPGGMAYRSAIPDRPRRAER